MTQLLVIGTASNDTLRLPDGRVVHTIGGAGLYTALAGVHAGAAASVGAAVTLLAPRADPMPADFAAAAARLRWLGPVVPAGDLPSLDIAHLGGGRARLNAAHWGVEAALLPEHLPRDLSEYDVTHIAALSSAARQRAFLDAARARGARRISVGTYARLIQSDAEAVRAVLAGADLVFMNDNEAGLLELPGRPLSTRPDALLFITRGAAGARVIGRGLDAAVPAPEALEVDPTGAGDTFCGAALHALASGRDPVSAARAGCALASHMIAFAGPAGLSLSSRAQPPLPRSG